MSTEALTTNNTVERRLVEIWSELLSVDSVNPTQNFFELGGDSVLAMMLMAQVEQEFGVWIEMADIFDRPTIDELTPFLVKAGSVPAR